jgi:hypothetical protein
MKHVVRAFVAVLVLTGAVATTQTPAATTAKNKVTAARTSILPVPVCPPDDPNACGLGLGR